MKVVLFLFAFAFVSTIAQGSTSTEIQTTTAAPSKATTKPDVIVVIPTKKPTTPAPRRTVVTCEEITIQCPNDESVVIDEVYRGRKKDRTCTKDKPGCCPKTLNATTDCYQKNDNLLSTQQRTCEQFTGMPCPIYKPNELPIPCEGGEQLLSYFRVVVFHCIYVPTTTSNITTVPVTTSTTSQTTTSKTTSTSPTVTSPGTAKPTSSTEAPQELPIPIIAGASGGGVLLILLIILIVCCCRRRRQTIQREDMTKADKGVTPVKDVGVNYMDVERANSSSDPDIIKTASPNDYSMYSMPNGH